jgi:hypothetical protein
MRTIRACLARDTATGCGSGLLYTIANGHQDQVEAPRDVPIREDWDITDHASNGVPVNLMAV